MGCKSYSSNPNDPLIQNIKYTHFWNKPDPDLSGLLKECTLKIKCENNAANIKGLGTTQPFMKLMINS